MSTQLREKMARHRARIWVLGDVMLDRYIIGTVERVSPEAPVPVLLLNERQQRVGGAANVAHNLAALGAEVALGGSIGNDEAGAELRALVEATGVRAEGLVRRDVPTTTKLRALAGAQQLLRVDDERRVPFESADRDAVIAGCANAVPDPAVVLISDYDKGVVSQELIAAVRRAT